MKIYPIKKIVKCTEPELIGSGSSFLQLSSLEPYFIGKNYLEFCGDELDVNDQLMELSKENPEEFFTSIIFRKLDIDNAEKIVSVIFNGRHNHVTTEPYYYFVPPSLQDVDPALYDQFTNHVMVYIKRLDLIHETLDKITYDFPYDKEIEGGYPSSITISWRNNDHEFNAFKSSGSEIEVSVRKIKDPKKETNSGSEDQTDERDVPNIRPSFNALDPPLLLEGNVPLTKSLHSGINGPTKII